MGRLAIVGGHNVLDSPFAADAQPIAVDVPGVTGATTTVHVRDAGGFVFLQRHGISAYRPPHLLDHVANLRALLEVGCDRVLAVGSCGSLRPELAVGQVVALNDFIVLDPVASTYGDERGHGGTDLRSDLESRGDRRLERRGTGAARRELCVLADDRPALRDRGRDPIDTRSSPTSSG